MADVLKFEVAPERRMPPRKTPPACEDDFSFWPEVESGLWVVSNAQHADPANGPARVLREIVLILATTAAIVTAISLFVGTPPAV